MTALLELGADVERTDAAAAAAAERAAAAGSGRLAELRGWLAGTAPRVDGSFPGRPRLLHVGPVPGAVAELAAAAAVGTVQLADEGAAVEAVAAGVAAVDREVDGGADLLVLAAAPRPEPVAVAVSVLTGTEPVALLPRGAGAVDTAAWIARAVAVRDRRRDAAGLGAQPDALLEALDCPAFAVCVGVALRAAARRTPLVLDGATAVVAALLGEHVQARATQWWQVADSSADPAQVVAVERLELRPLLQLGIGAGTGTAGLLAVAVLRAAAASGTA